MNSDHLPILLTLSDTIIRKQNYQSLGNKMTAWKSFKIKIEESYDLAVPLQIGDQLDEEIDRFVRSSQHAVRDNTPETVPRTKGNNFPTEIKYLLICDKRKLRRNW